MQRAFAEPPGLVRQVANAVEGIPIDFAGGCSVAKGTLLALLAHDRGLPSIDIGVYRGRSLLPQAVAQARLGGMAVGIDPYDREEARQVDRPDMLDALEAWRRTCDPEGLYREVLERIRRLGLQGSCRLVRLPSRHAGPHIHDLGRCGLVHIDGNHDEVNVRTDIALACPRIAAGGWLVMDDPSWPSVGRAMAAIPHDFVPVHREQAAEDYAVFWRRGPLRSTARARAYCAWAASASKRACTDPGSSAGPTDASR